MNRAIAEQFNGLLHFRFDSAFCLPKSPTGQYYQVESWIASVPYLATYDNLKSAQQFAQQVSKFDRYDAKVIKLNV